MKIFNQNNDYSAFIWNSKGISKKIWKIILVTRSQMHAGYKFISAFCLLWIRKEKGTNCDLIYEWKKVNN